MSHTDELTNLPNRRSFTETLARAITHARRTQNPLTIALLDVDHFKVINDTYGHGAGDVVLETLAKILEKSVRGEDHVSRIGGEEFAIILIDTDLDFAKEYSGRLLKKIESDLKVVFNPGTTISATVSIGVAKMDAAETSLSLIERVDRALYSAKNGGRNRMVIAPIEK
ncbi:MAG: GGDEF domain-containing protein [Minisyncoccia bacterium]